MPLIVWAYPRGTAIDAKGGKDSFYAVDYAARTASELGADMVKVNFPPPEKRPTCPSRTGPSSRRTPRPEKAVSAGRGRRSSTPSQPPSQR